MAADPGTGDRQPYACHVPHVQRRGGYVKHCSMQAGRTEVRDQVQERPQLKLVPIQLKCSASRTMKLTWDTTNSRAWSGACSHEYYADDCQQLKDKGKVHWREDHLLYSIACLHTWNINTSSDSAPSASTSVKFAYFRATRRPLSLP